MESGKLTEVARGLSVDDESSSGVAPVDSRTDRSTVSGGEHGEVVLHQCGLLGVRVGEASHPHCAESFQKSANGAGDSA